jgi:mono/diheme cytochrome c family protein
MRMFLLMVVAVLAGGSGVLAQDAAKVAAGKVLYDSQGCAKCHQVAGTGNKMSVLDGVGSKLSVEDLRLWLTDPEAMMAKLPKRPIIKMKKVELPDPDLDAIVAYLQSLKTK